MTDTPRLPTDPASGGRAILQLRRLVALVPLAVAGGALAACDTGTLPEDDGEHAEPAEVVLTLDGQEIARADETGSTGEIHVPAGEETGPVTVEFVDADGDPIQLDDDLYLDVEVEDETVAEFEQDGPGAFGGHVHGHETGETTAVFRLMHGEVGAGHQEWSSAEVTVHVE